MSYVQIEITRKDGSVKQYDFQPVEFGVAQALMQMLSVQQNDDDVVLWLLNGQGQPSKIADKAEVQDAMRQQRIANIQGNGMPPGIFR